MPTTAVRPARRAIRTVNHSDFPGARPLGAKNGHLFFGQGAQRDLSCESDWFLEREISEEWRNAVEALREGMAPAVLVSGKQGSGVSSFLNGYLLPAMAHSSHARVWDLRNGPRSSEKGHRPPNLDRLPVISAFDHADAILRRDAGSGGNLDALGRQVANCLDDKMNVVICMNAAHKETIREALYGSLSRYGKPIEIEIDRLDSDAVAGNLEALISRFGVGQPWFAETANHVLGVASQAADATWIQLAARRIAAKNFSYQLKREQIEGLVKSAVEEYFDQSVQDISERLKSGEQQMYRSICRALCGGSSDFNAWKVYWELVDQRLVRYPFEKDSPLGHELMRPRFQVLESRIAARQRRRRILISVGIGALGLVGLVRFIARDEPRPPRTAQISPPKVVAATASSTKPAEPVPEVRRVAPVPGSKPGKPAPEIEVPSIEAASVSIPATAPRMDIAGPDGYSKRMARIAREVAKAGRVATALHLMAEARGALPAGVLPASVAQDALEVVRQAMAPQPVGPAEDRSFVFDSRGELHVEALPSLTALPAGGLLGGGGNRLVHWKAGTAKVWHLDGSGIVRHVAASNDYLFAIGSDGYLRQWTVSALEFGVRASGERVARLGGALTAFAVGRPERPVAAVITDGVTLQLYDQFALPKQSRRLPSPAVAMAMSPDGKYIATADAAGSIDLFTTEPALSEVWRLAPGISAEVSRLAFVNQSSLIIAERSGRILIAADVTSRKSPPAGVISDGLPGPVDALSVSGMGAAAWASGAEIRAVRNLPEPAILARGLQALDGRDEPGHAWALVAALAGSAGPGDPAACNGISTLTEDDAELCAKAFQR